MSWYHALQFMQRPPLDMLTRSRPAPNFKAPWWLMSSVPLVLAAIFWLMAVGGKSGKCTTYDELAYITTGYTYWKLNDYRMLPEHGNLNARYLTLPVLLLNPNLPRLDQESWQSVDTWEYPWQFFYESGNNPDRMLFWCRAMMGVLGAALVILVWSCARQWFGVAGAIVAAVLCAFNPTMLAQGAMATTDVSVTLMFLISLLAMWKMLHRLSFATVLGAGAAMTVLFMTKMSAVLILPVIFLLLVLRLVNGKPLETGWPLGGRLMGRVQLLAGFAPVFLVIAVGIWISIWAAYGFRYSIFHEPRSPKDRIELNDPVWRAGEGWKGELVTAAMDRRILPEAYLTGVRGVFRIIFRQSAFLNGRWSDDGFIEFFPYALAVKTPLPFFILLVMSAAATVIGWARSRFPRQSMGRAFYNTAPLWMFVLVYGYFALTSSLNIGIRHILPVHPMMFILAGGAAGWLVLRYRMMTVLVAACLLWYMIESLAIAPHYMAYFNQLAGGPENGYRHLTDSSVDGGENLPLLRDWIDANQERLRNPPVYLSYFGHGDLRYYKVKAIEFAGWGEFHRRPVLHVDPLKGGTYCISAYMLAQGCRWSEERERQYQELRRIVEALRQAQRDPATLPKFLSQRPEAFWRQLLFVFAYLQSDRLSAYLWPLHPYHQIGYSILIYDLTDEQVQQALLGPSP